MTKYRLIGCPDCETKGYVYVYDLFDREIGIFPCPTCKESIRPGFILKKIVEKKNKSKMLIRQSWRI